MSVESIKNFDENILPEIVNPASFGELERFLAGIAICFPEIKNISQNDQGGEGLKLSSADVAIAALCTIGIVGWLLINRARGKSDSGSSSRQRGGDRTLANRPQGGIDCSAPTGDDPDATDIIKRFFDGGSLVVEDSASEITTTREDIIQKPSGERRTSRRTRVEKKASHRKEEKKPVVAVYEVHRDSRFKMLMEGLEMLGQIEDGRISTGRVLPEESGENSRCWTTEPRIVTDSSDPDVEFYGSQ